MEPKMTVSAVEGQIAANSTKATMIVDVPMNTGQFTGEWEFFGAGSGRWAALSGPPSASGGRGFWTAWAITVLSIDVRTGPTKSRARGGRRPVRGRSRSRAQATSDRIVTS